MKRRIAILGKNGRLGAALCRALADSFEILPFGRADLDLTKPLANQLADAEFDLLINTAAATNVDWCEQHENVAARINGHAVGALGSICAERRVRCVHVSTDYVFDGSSSQPHTEEDEASPICVYGLTKRLGERLLLKANPGNLVVRVSWVFGPDKPSFVDWALDQAMTRTTVSAVNDKFAAPTYTLDFAEWIRPFLFDLAIGGILHLCNSGGCSWREYAQFAIEVACDQGVKITAPGVDPIPLNSMKAFVARRPINTVLATDKYTKITGQVPRPWQQAVRDFVRRKFSETR
jgi:dTDP-4-dehydrorhamnose reductase